MHRNIATLLLMLGISVAVAAPPPWPTITDIQLVGNKVTRDHVILREMALQVGEPAVPDAIERSRQAILDLKLFREVELETVPTAGGVAVVVRVREKRYFLPVPRGDLSSDSLAYGAQLRWSNVGGRNHRLNAYIEDSRAPNDRRITDETVLRVAYDAPFIGGTPFDLHARVEHAERKRRNPLGSYDEGESELELRLARDFTTGRPRRGWTVGAGVLWQNQSTSGPMAPRAEGMATALVGTVDYADLHYRIYSETGRRFRTRLELASDALLSEYSYRRIESEYFESRAIGDVPHQTLHFLAAAGSFDGGRNTRNPFELGGSSRMRGYDSDFLVGERFWYAAVEYLRPLRWDWLRLLLLAEVGGTDRDVFGLSPDGAFASVGAGLRIRLTWFVDIEIELGIAAPLRGGGGVQFFAGSN